MTKHRVFNRKAALDRVNGDKSLYLELVAVLYSDLHDNMRSIEDAVVESDPKALLESAHALKGALANLGADNASEKAFLLERAGESGELGACSESLRELKWELQKFLDEIEAFRKES